jgi:predicted O-methyltransferase YrrM
MSQPCGFPDGHYYSPVVDPAELAVRESAIWPNEPQVLGIDFDDASHLRILQTYFPRYIGEYDYAEQAPSSDEELTAFYTQNSEFSWLDARTLFVLLREWQPKRVVEVGSGYSSLLMADVNKRFLAGRSDITCVEPYPRPFLRKGIAGISRVIEQKVQDAPLQIFEALQAGDILFIDTTHVAKTGGDVNHLYFEVLPRLRKGVRIHIHDIFLPHDYPKVWVLRDNRSWNEQYLVRALLMYSTAFRVVFSCSYAFHRFPIEVGRALALPGGEAFGGGSLWIERI